MAPIRRYLRITKASVLEVRIYLDKPSDAGWLRSTTATSNSTAGNGDGGGAPLPRILAAVRPFVLPKLREENELAARGGRAASAAAGRGGSRTARTRSKKKQRGIKDVVEGVDFEATVFLTDQSSRHSLLTKRKAFAERRPRLRGGGKGLAGWVNRGADAADAIRIDGEEREGILREGEEGEVELGDIPEADVETRRATGEAAGEEALFVNSDDDDDGTDGADDKKKLALSTSYDGFSIYGRILCLIVKRKGSKATAAGIPTGGSEMMEQWVGTQAAQAAGLDEDDEG